MAAFWPAGPPPTASRSKCAVGASAPARAELIALLISPVVWPILRGSSFRSGETSVSSALVERGGETLAHRSGKRVGIAELGERAHHRTPDAITRVPGCLLHALEQRAQPRLVLAACERLEAEPRNRRGIRIGRKLA